MTTTTHTQLTELAKEVEKLDKARPNKGEIRVYKSKHDTFIGRAGGEFIAKLMSSYGYDADMLLFAKAPEMASALQFAVDELQKLHLALLGIKFQLHLHTPANNKLPNIIEIIEQALQHSGGEDENNN